MAARGLCWRVGHPQAAGGVMQPFVGWLLLGKEA